MVLKEAVARGVAAGSVNVAFRRWDRARVRTGSRFRSVAGVIEVAAVTELGDERELTEADALAAGAGSLAALVAELGKRPGARLYRIELRWAGADDRLALASRDSLTVGERAELEATLAGFDARSRSGPWTGELMAAIEAAPGAPSRALAAGLGLEQRQLKARVRRLKELGLTNSLGTGYELSARGRALRRGERE